MSPVRRVSSLALRNAGFIDFLPELDPSPYPGLPADFPKTCPTASTAAAAAFFGAYPITGDVSVETP